MLLQPIPLGYCQCGCGNVAPVARCADKRSKVKLGQSLRFIRGHRALKLPACQAVAPSGPVGRVPVFRRGVVPAYAQFDAADWGLVARLRWGMNKDGYAVTSRAGVGWQMHRLLLALVIGDLRQGDHINRDRLDNRRANLRLATPAIQAQNRSSYRGSTSSHRGVCWAKDTHKWQAQVRANGKTHYLGQFEHEADAAAVCEAFRAEHMPYSEDARRAA